MASIFRKDDRFYDQPNRNNFDLSFQNNLTLNAGNIVPVLCKEVIPGDSFKIDPTFGIRAMPLVWPIQTRMKCYMHFYYVRNRNLWKDWQDFIGGTKQNLVLPYIYLNEENRDMINTGSIGDYFGIPSVTYGEFGNIVSSLVPPFYYDHLTDQYDQDSRMYLQSFWSVGSNFFSNTYITRVQNGGSWPSATPRKIIIIDKNDFPDVDFSNGVKLNLTNTSSSYTTTYSTEITFLPLDVAGNVSDNATGTSYTIVHNQDTPVELTQQRFIDCRYIAVIYNGIQFANANLSSSLNPLSVYISGKTQVSSGIENKDAELSDLPFISDQNVNGLRLSALPFRAYEAIYNCFYRNAENNPLIGPDGQPEYNKWILNNEGGADTTHYKLHQRNWEDDFLTTALPSPQQGNAPLVGLVGSATINFASEDGTEQVTAQLDENGNVRSIASGNSSLSDALNSMVDYGISINDFRNVNSLQRWLENNIRRGYKYQDQIQTHYGVSVRYDELDMPEFIGGTSESFMINQISQTVSSDTQVLGDYAGQASCVGSGNSITHYCDEHGYIIGVMCISPVPNYSQLLPKHFLKSDKFEIFFPEFGHIGPQPIPLKEITPLQTWRQQQADASVNMDDTFGYQRAWYEYLASTDEVHGLFRNQLRNFLINRTFDQTPELGAEFTTIDPDQVNDVFAVQDTAHKFLGQVYFDISAKRPIPLYGIPKLE